FDTAYYHYNTHSAGMYKTTPYLYNCSSILLSKHYSLIILKHMLSCFDNPELRWSLLHDRFPLNGVLGRHYRRSQTKGDCSNSNSTGTLSLTKNSKTLKSVNY